MPAGEESAVREEYNKLNVRLLCILSYIGPLFIMGRVAVEKDVPEVDFHSRQGGALFCVTAVAYILAGLLHVILQALPAISEILDLLLFVGISVAWFILACMGISSAIKKQQTALPFISDLGKLWKK